MTKLTPNFTLEELTRTSTGLPNDYTVLQAANILRLAETLQTIRDALQRPIRVSSGFRNKQVNQAVGGSKYSAHLQGLAADITSPGISSRELAEFIRTFLPAWDQIILEFPDSPVTWVHLGIGPQSRKQCLIATRVNGLTQYEVVKDFLAKK